jgi:hypothetical protein
LEQRDGAIRNGKQPNDTKTGSRLAHKALEVLRTNIFLENTSQEHCWREIAPLPAKLGNEKAMDVMVKGDNDKLLPPAP